MKTSAHLPEGLLFTGLDGSNPLAFLAALGTLRTLTLAWPDRRVKMSWIDHAGAWRPVITATNLRTANDGKDQRHLLQQVHDQITETFDKHPLAVLTELSDVAPKMLREWYSDHVKAAKPYNLGRDKADWLSAVSSDSNIDATSQLQTVRRDYFIGNLRSIVERTTADHLERCLFRQWDYADALENQSLHLDPTEDRRHAYQWNKPSGDPDRKRKGAVLGANRLAIEAFPFFQSVASGNKLSTRGFHGNRKDDTRWTWPIWSCWLGCEAVGSLLALADLQLEQPTVQSLKSRGIAAVFRCRRILVEKTPNFTPATAVF